MSNPLLNLISVISGFPNLDKCLSFCDINAFSDILTINERTLDKIEIYLQKKCSNMPLKERYQMIGEQFADNPGIFRFSPAVRQRILSIIEKLDKIFNNPSLPINVVNINSICNKILQNNNLAVTTISMAKFKMLSGENIDHNQLVPYENSNINQAKHITNVDQMENNSKETYPNFFQRMNSLRNTDNVNASTKASPLENDKINDKEIFNKENVLVDAINLSDKPKLATKRNLSDILVTKVKKIKTSIGNQSLKPKLSIKKTNEKDYSNIISPVRSKSQRLMAKTVTMKSKELSENLELSIPKLHLTKNTEKKQEKSKTVDSKTKINYEFANEFEKPIVKVKSANISNLSKKSELTESISKEIINSNKVSSQIISLSTNKNVIIQEFPTQKSSLCMIKIQKKSESSSLNASDSTQIQKMTNTPPSLPFDKWKPPMPKSQDKLLTHSPPNIALMSNMKTITISNTSAINLPKALLTPLYQSAPVKSHGKVQLSDYPFQSCLSIPTKKFSNINLKSIYNRDKSINETSSPIIENSKLAPCRFQQPIDTNRVDTIKYRSISKTDIPISLATHNKLPRFGVPIVTITEKQYSSPNTFIGGSQIKKLPPIGMPIVTTIDKPFISQTTSPIVTTINKSISQTSLSNKSSEEVTVPIINNAVEAPSIMVLTPPSQLILKEGISWKNSPNIIMNRLMNGKKRCKPVQSQTSSVTTNKTTPNTTNKAAQQ